MTESETMAEHEICVFMFKVGRKTSCTALAGFMSLQVSAGVLNFFCVDFKGIKRCNLCISSFPVEQTDSSYLFIVQYYNCH